MVDPAASQFQPVVCLKRCCGHSTQARNGTCYRKAIVRPTITGSAWCSCACEAKPENLIGDRAYDSDPLDEELRKDGIEMIAPHRSNRTKPPTQDRRRLSRYMRRWLVERFFACRVMKVHGLLLDRHCGGAERRHDGRIAVDERNRRWCSDGFEIGCDNGEKVRLAFALDC